MLLIHLGLLDRIGRHNDHTSVPTGRAHSSVPFWVSRNPLLLPGQESREDIAREICRMVDYHLPNGLQGICVLQLMFPLRVAHRDFDPFCREATWLRRIMLKIADSEGFEMGRHILDVTPAGNPIERLSSKYRRPSKF